MSLFESHVHSHFAGEDQPVHQASEPVRTDMSLDVAEPPLSGQSTVECDAPGCRMIVSIEKMVEHTDRHLAERIQGQSSTGAANTKLSVHGEGFIPRKRERSQSTDTTAFYKEDGIRRRANTSFSEADGVHDGPTEAAKTAGQTTMDGFLKNVSSSSSASPSWVSRPFQLTFVPKPPTSASGTAGLINSARILLNVSMAQGITRRAYLADPSVVFCQGDKTDRGWGCGYRNLQMMLSYVVHQNAARQDVVSDNSGSSRIPTIPELQQQIEFAWKNGFDRAGAKQLGHTIAGTRKWIGTTEVWSVLSSLGVRCSVLDFHSPTGPNGTHPVLLSAIYNYFRTPAWSPLTAPPVHSFQDYGQLDADRRIIQTAKPPLYLQHQGHSRTIVGVEVLATGELNLLVFDPGRWLHRSIPTLREESLSKAISPSLGSKVAAERGLLDAQYLLKAFRLQLNAGASKSQYQLLGISGLYHDGGGNAAGARKNALGLFRTDNSLSIGWNEGEAQESKLVSSTRVP
ncbi:hypothetical protein BGZ58_007091 [Dissophora ornata]|nr:hypothetical protein BGZ58_007091 [Dissophora ornata]